VAHKKEKKGLDSRFRIPSEVFPEREGLITPVMGVKKSRAGGGMAFFIEIHVKERA